MRRLLRRLGHRRAPTSAPLILMYHRIADATVDPWGLAVPATRFKAQLEALKGRRQVLPLREFAAMHQAGRLPANALAITFDDGYACNATLAAPMLAEHEMPATFFLATGQIGNAREFWWDELTRLCFEAESAGEHALRIGSEMLSFDLGPAERIVEAFDALGPPRTQRQAGYLKLWQGLRDCDVSERIDALDRLWRGTLGGTPPPARASHRAMTADEVCAMSQTELVEIGAHTVNHPALGLIDPTAQKHEIDESRRVCEALTGQPPRSFAYPHGHYTDTTIAHVRSAGFVSACATRESVVESNSGVFELPRLQVRNWDGHGLLRAIETLELRHQADHFEAPLRE